MNRITRKDLDHAANLLNVATNSPLTYSAERKAGEPYAANVGHYTVAGAYGGWALHQVCNASGGINEVSRCGYAPARTLLHIIHALIAGVAIGKGVQS